MHGSGKHTDHGLLVTPARGQSALKRLRTRFPTRLHTILTPASPTCTQACFALGSAAD